MRKVEDAVHTLVGNPYALSSEELSQAEDILGSHDPRGTIDRHLEDGLVEDASRTVLAVGHVQARQHVDDPDRVLTDRVLTKAAARRLPRPRGEYLRTVMAAARCHRALRYFQGSSAAMREVRRATWAACFGDSLVHAITLAKVIRDHDVLIVGETGTGKESIAYALQEGAVGPADGSPAPRSALNAAAVPDTLIESQLFGHVKGAFTGASETRKGCIRTAHGGSFFLDEVGDLAPTTQVKLLRVIETDEVHPLGSDATHVADCRYIAATHKDLDEMVDRGVFRRDLFMRLAGNVIRLPSLAERPEDIPEIGRAFVRRHLPEGQLPETRDRLYEWLESPEAQRCRWPGNVRGLQNALRNMLLGLPPGIGEERAPLAEGGGEALPPQVRECQATMRDVEEWYLARVLDHTTDNLAHSARILGVDRTTVRRRARKLGRG
ncbi:MAG: sigma-54-dependent Fis family transcriptional regulator [Deltaproteobacteria bacterium]|nr:MAG: sigma-54-dependent Fis family transcriptional regulator [Deltaproteobacteria bacterium]